MLQATQRAENAKNDGKVAKELSVRKRRGATRCAVAWYAALDSIRYSWRVRRARWYMIYQRPFRQAFHPSVYIEHVRHDHVTRYGRPVICGRRAERGGACPCVRSSRERIAYARRAHVRACLFLLAHAFVERDGEVDMSRRVIEVAGR